MGLTFRKTLKAGLFRFSFSKSGIGVSLGYGGFRYGLGPRGNYISICKGIFRFHQFLSTSHPPRSTASSMQSDHGAEGNLDLLSTVECSQNRLIQDFQEKAENYSIFPISLILFIGLSIYLITNEFNPLVTSIVLFPLLFLLNFTYQFDRARKTVILFYEITPDFERRYEEALKAFNALSSSQKVSRIYNSDHVFDRKYHAGAANLIKSEIASFSLSGPSNLECNVATPTITTGSTQFLFLPERLIVFSNSGVFGFEYKDIAISQKAIKFIEEGYVPSEAQVAGQTWRFVNKDGSPDKRFNNNYSIPVLFYEELDLTTSTDLIGRFHGSKYGALSAFFVAWKELSNPEAASNVSNKALSTSEKLSGAEFKTIVGAMIDLFGLLLNAEDNQVGNEIPTIRKYLEEISDSESMDYAFVRQRLISAVKETVDPEAPCLVLRRDLSSAQKTSYIEMCYRIAKLNNVITAGEQKVLNYISVNLGVGSMADEDNEDTQRELAKNLEWAYKILGVPVGSCIERVKEVYRFKAQQAHPDKVDFMDQEIKDLAKRKFLDLKRAYDAIVNSQKEKANE